jgi:hypothetical protein
MLAILTADMELYLTSILKGIREEYLITTLTIPIVDGMVSIPGRAVGGALRSVERLDAHGKKIPVVRIEPERLVMYGGATGTDAFGYVLKGNKLILVPAQAGGSLEVSYQQRLGELVLPEACGLITNIVGSTITISPLPASFTTSTLYDFVSSTPNFSTSAIDQTFSSVTGGTLVCDVAPPAALQIGDYVAPAGQSPIPQVPSEAHYLLAQKGAESIAAATGSTRLQAIQSALAQAKADTIALMSPRTDGSSRPIVNKYGPGFTKRYGR